MEAERPVPHQEGSVQAAGEANSASDGSPSNLMASRVPCRFSPVLQQQPERGVWSPPKYVGPNKNGDVRSHGEIPQSNARSHGTYDPTGRQNQSSEVMSSSEAWRRSDLNHHRPPLAPLRLYSASGQGQVDDGSEDDVRGSENGTLHAPQLNPAHHPFANLHHQPHISQYFDYSAQPMMAYGGYEELGLNALSMMNPVPSPQYFRSDRSQQLQPGHFGSNRAGPRSHGGRGHFQTADRQHQPAPIGRGPGGRRGTARQGSSERAINPSRSYGTPHTSPVVPSAAVETPSGNAQNANSSTAGAGGLALPHMSERRMLCDRVPVPPECLGALIGRRGVTRSRLQAESGVTNISIMTSSAEVVLTSPDRACIARARALITEVIDEFHVQQARRTPFSSRETSFHREQHHSNHNSSPGRRSSWHPRSPQTPEQRPGLSYPVSGGSTPYGGGGSSSYGQSTQQPHQHWRTSPKRFLCGSCGRGFSTELSLADHAAAKGHLAMHGSSGRQGGGQLSHAGNESEEAHEASTGWGHGLASQSINHSHSSDLSQHEDEDDGVYEPMPKTPSPKSKLSTAVAAALPDAASAPSRAYAASGEQRAQDSAGHERHADENEPDEPAEFTTPQRAGSGLKVPSKPARRSLLEHNNRRVPVEHAGNRGAPSVTGRLIAEVTGQDGVAVEGEEEQPGAVAARLSAMDLGGRGYALAAE
eukprot:g62157.t1